MSELDPNFPPMFYRNLSRNGPLLPVSDTNQDLIIRRSNLIAADPSQELTDFGSELLSELTSGNTVGSIALKHEVKSSLLTENICRQFEVSNTLAAVYRALLHGIIEPPDWQTRRRRLELSTNQYLELYLANIGFERQEAADITDIAPITAYTALNHVRFAFDSRSLHQATARAFSSGIYRSLKYS